MRLYIKEAAEDLRQRRCGPEEVLADCLERIAQYEAQVRAWVFVDRKGAQAQARQLGHELAAGHYRGPLHGIPVGIKDIFDVFDWPTAAGAAGWAQSIARQDSAVVARLRAAGAVLLGKTVTTPYASFDPAVTRNPWDVSRTPGGSSSGSAAAVACGMCYAALASQTGGSTIRPAAYCGVAGLKPTYGVLPRRGMVPLAASLDHVGIIARSVPDLALVWNALAVPPASRRAAVQGSCLATGAPLHRPPRLGRLRGFFEERAEPLMRRLLEDVSSRLQAAGAALQDWALPADFAKVLACHRLVMAVEAAAFHEARLKAHPEDYPPRIRELLEEGLRCPAPTYARCKEHQRRLRRQVRHLFADRDALLTPATPGAAPPIETTGDPVFNSPWSYVGLPAITFPAGFDPQGLPLGIQLVGRWGREADLLAVAAWCAAVLAVEQRLPPCPRAGKGE
jgi:Asp-tRNA(Asn)/Glu-tRNA(Gln) amidotransferase A subunit family amidase